MQLDHIRRFDFSGATSKRGSRRRSLTSRVSMQREGKSIGEIGEHSFAEEEFTGGISRIKGGKVETLIEAPYNLEKNMRLFKQANARFAAPIAAQ